jgi:hypothetical protein
MRSEKGAPADWARAAKSALMASMPARFGMGAAKV